MLPREVKPAGHPEITNSKNGMGHKSGEKRRENIT
jgi:hypothetical protein